MPGGVTIKARHIYIHTQGVGRTTPICSPLIARKAYSSSKQAGLNKNSQNQGSI